MEKQVSQKIERCWKIVKSWTDERKFDKKIMHRLKNKEHIYESHVHG